MAARVVKIRHDDETRAKIQTSQLINRLTEHALGNVEMPATAVTAALGLIKKTLPDLAAVEHSGDADNPIALGIAWLDPTKTASSASTTDLETNSSPSTTAPSDGPAS